MYRLVGCILSDKNNIFSFWICVPTHLPFGHCVWVAVFWSLYISVAVLRSLLKSPGAPWSYFWWSLLVVITPLWLLPLGPSLLWLHPDHSSVIESKWSPFSGELNGSKFSCSSCRATGMDHHQKNLMGTIKSEFLTRYTVLWATLSSMCLCVCVCVCVCMYVLEPMQGSQAHSLPNLFPDSLLQKFKMAAYLFPFKRWGEGWMAKLRYGEENIGWVVLSLAASTGRGIEVVACKNTWGMVWGQTHFANAVWMESDLVWQFLACALMCFCCGAVSRGGDNCFEFLAQNFAYDFTLCEKSPYFWKLHALYILLCRIHFDVKNCATRTSNENGQPEWEACLLTRVATTGFFFRETYVVGRKCSVCAICCLCDLTDLLQTSQACADTCWPHFILQKGEQKCTEVYLHDSQCSTSRPVKFFS